MRRLAALCLALSTAVAALPASDAITAPAFALPDAQGTVLSSTSLRGQVVLVDFWASWCVPCKASFPALDALHREFRDRGASVVAINLDEERKAANAFLASRPHQMPVLFDPKGITATAFVVKGMPSSVLIDRRGVIRYRHEGFSEKTLAQYRIELTQLLGEKTE